MQENFLISVIVPVYNLENTIERCARSILAQTHTNLELILVDDGSRDGSRDKIRSIAAADERVITVFKENGGVTSARLVGIEHAGGDYIGFTDGDDEIDPDMYELLLKNMLDSGAEISHCGHRMVYDNGKTNYLHGTGIKFEQDKTASIAALLSGELVEPGLCTKLFSRRVVMRFMSENRMDGSIKVNEDLLMNYYLFEKADRTVFEDVCKYKYYATANSALNRNRIFDPIRVKEIIYSGCGQKIKSMAEQAIARTCVYTYCSLVMEGGFEEEKKQVRGILLQHKQAAKALPPRTRVLARLIWACPYVFPALYKLYSSGFQKKKYE